MAIKKTELYSSLWASCDELRGGMDASQYKDYVLTMLFIKYVSDKYKNDPYGMIVVPQGASFDDMVALKGDKEIGDKITLFPSRRIFTSAVENLYFFGRRTACERPVLKIFAVSMFHLAIHPVMVSINNIYHLIKKSSWLREYSSSCRKSRKQRINVSKNHVFRSFLATH